jgi:DNA-binding transcriptional ArsR family regulator
LLNTYFDYYVVHDCVAALADPTRQRIVDILAERELAAGDITRQFDMTAPAVSQHLKVPRSAAIVRVRIEGQRRWYAIEPARILELDRWFARFRRLWDRRLETFACDAHRPN